MATLFIRHRVADYATWKSVYDEVDGLRKQHGILAATVHRDASDPNVVIVSHRFKDMNGARGFASSEALRSAMQRAGVQGQPEFWVGEDLEEVRYSY